MRDRSRRFLCMIILIAASGVGLALPVRGAGPSFRFGLAFDYLSRRITWDQKARESDFTASLVTGRAEVAVEPWLSLTVMAGLSLADFNGLVFRNLPISLDYEGGAVSGIAAGAEVRADLLRSGDFEIQGSGRFVSSFGLSKTLPLEGFAVAGTASGKPAWMMASAGPRFSYLFFGKFVPYVSVEANWLWGDFRMTESLADLAGTEKKAIRGKSFVEAAVGAEFTLGKRLLLKGRAGFLPYAGGTDAEASLAIFYMF